MSDNNELRNIYNVVDIHEARSMYCDLQAKLATVENKLIDKENECNEYLDKLQKARVKHIDDINNISKALLEKAEDKDFCDEFDEFIDNLNEVLNLSLETRQREFEVIYVVKKAISYRTNAFISAKDATEAEQYFYDNSSDYIDTPVRISEWDEDDEECEVIEVIRN